MELYRQLLAAAGILLTIAAFLPYVRDIRAGRTRPHAFSWFVWGLATLIVFFAQLAAGGGIGTWPVGFSGAVQLFIALLAWLHRADTVITRADWLFLAGSLSALPLWFATQDPLWAVVILTLVDLIAYGPTIRRAWHRPHEESVPMFAHFAVRNVLVILALERYSLATLLFPVTLGIACALFVLLLIYRRRVLAVAPQSAHSGAAQ